MFYFGFFYVCQVQFLKHVKTSFQCCGWVSTEWLWPEFEVQTGSFVSLFLIFEFKELAKVMHISFLVRSWSHVIIWTLLRGFFFPISKIECQWLTWSIVRSSFTSELLDFKLLSFFFTYLLLFFYGIQPYKWYRISFPVGGVYKCLKVNRYAF